MKGLITFCFFVSLLITLLPIVTIGQNCHLLIPTNTFLSPAGIEESLNHEDIYRVNFDFDFDHILIVINRTYLKLVEKETNKWNDLTNVINAMNHTDKGLKYFDKLEDYKIYLSPDRFLFFGKDTIRWNHHPVMYQPPYELFNFKLHESGFYGIYAPSVQFVQGSTDLVLSSYTHGFSASLMAMDYNFANGLSKVVPIMTWIKINPDSRMPSETIEPHLGFERKENNKTYALYRYSHLENGKKYFCVSKLKHEDNTYSLDTVFFGTCWESKHSTFNDLVEKFKFLPTDSYWYFYSGYDFRAYNYVKDTSWILPINFVQELRVIDFAIYDNTLSVIVEGLNNSESSGVKVSKNSFTYEYKEYDLTNHSLIRSCIIQQSGDKKWLKFDESGRLIKQVSKEENKILIHEMHIAN